MSNYKQFIPAGKTVYMGIDLHLKSWHVTAIVEDEEVFNGSMPPDPELFLKFLKRYDPNPIESVYEAGYFGFWLYELLMNSGIKCTVTPPSLLPVESGNRVKTDRRDSRKLAHLLSKGLLKEVWVPSPQLCGHRQVLRRRQKLIGDRKRVQHRIKSELAFYDIRIARPRGAWSANFVKQLKDITFPDPFHQQCFWVLLEEYEYLNQSVEQMTHLLEDLAATEPYAGQVKLLKTLPGIGLISSMSLLLELGDITRFAKGEKLSAYLGLTPAQYSSGEKIRMGRITKTGKASLRGTLIQAAWRAVKEDLELQTVFNNLKVRSGKKRAIVAIARRLLLRTRRILLDQRPYNLIEAA